MRRSTTAVLTLATLAGGGTTVWTIGSLEPARVEVVDIRARLIADLMEAPDRIDSWTRIAQHLLSLMEERGDLSPEAAVNDWLSSLEPAWALDAGAEGMVWYSMSHQLAARAGRQAGSGMIFEDPAATEARQRAIDLLLSHSQTRSASMYHWHWNSVAWAWIRSGRFERASGALERTEEALLSLPADTPRDVIDAGLGRLLSAYSRQGLNDDRGAAKFLLRAARDIDERGASSAFASLGRANLAEPMLAHREFIPPSDAIDPVVRELREAPADEDRRRDWLRVTDLYLTADMPDELMHALEELEAQLVRHGDHPSNPRLTLNELGWRYQQAGDESKARDAWMRWLGEQERLAAADPSPANIYNLACGLSLVGQADAAIDALERAARAGWTNFGLIAQDRDLDQIRSHPRFRDAAERVRAAFYEESGVPLRSP